MLADKPPRQQETPEDKRQALFVWRKIAVLQTVQCCGMCGSTRYQTKPYWTLGMRVCRQCIQANLVSSIVLYERFWISFKQCVLGSIQFADLVLGNTFYFQTRLTPQQRMEYSTDALDFPGGLRTVWFFWKPHLSAVLDLELLAVQAKEKHQAASLIRAFARRAKVLRVLAGPGGNKRRPCVASFSVRRGMHTVFHELRKTLLLSHVDLHQEERQCLQLSTEALTRFVRNEDRLPPLLFA
jgi:hypothetical protein